MRRAATARLTSSRRTDLGTQRHELLGFLPMHVTREDVAEHRECVGKARVGHIHRAQPFEQFRYLVLFDEAGVGDGLAIGHPSTRQRPRDIRLDRLVKVDESRRAYASPPPAGDRRDAPRHSAPQ